MQGWGEQIDSADSLFDGLVDTTDVDGLNVLEGTGLGNIDADPLFYDPSGGDFRLKACSPCIDAGETSSFPLNTYSLPGAPSSDPIPDLSFNDRVIDIASISDDPTEIDMGAYERYELEKKNVTVDIELSPTLDDVNGPTEGGILERCITFELWKCPDDIVPAETVERVVGFPVDAAPFIASSINVEVSDLCYTCITARDRLHTLRSTAPDFTDLGTHFAATFVGNRATGGNWLVGGNLNDDSYIDVLDFGTFITRFGAFFGTGDTDCSTEFPHPDPSGDGLVFTGDFTFIQINFLERNEANCCGAAEPEFGGGESFGMFGPECDPGLLRLDFGNGTQVPDDCLQPGSGTNETLVVRVNMIDMNETVVGGQFFITYESSVLEFVEAVPGDEPFTRQVFEDVNTGAGTISYITGIENDGTGTTVDTTMAYLVFRVVGPDCASTSLVNLNEMSGDDIPTRLSGEDGVEIVPALESLPAFTVDGSGPFTLMLGVSSGNVDGSCEYVMTFSGVVLDDCAIDTGDVTVDVVVTTENADLGTPSYFVELWDPYTAFLSGSVVVSGLTSSPATVQVTLQAMDACSNPASWEDFLTGDALDEDIPSPCP